MKKTILSLLVLVLFISPNISNAQSFEKGNVLLNPGIGYGNRILGARFFRPNISFSADIGVHDYVSVGPYVATAFGGNGYNAFGVGARGNFHWWQLLDDKVAKDLKQDQFEMYFTLWLGASIVNVNTSGSGKANSSGFDGGTSLGLRWYPNANNRFALFSEWGRGPISWGTIGATIKVN